MGYLKLKSVEVDSTTKKLMDPLKFSFRFACSNEIKSGVEFVVLYNMDVHSDENDQVLAEVEIAPIPKGKIEFSIDADAPDVNKIPLDDMFGLTSILIIGKYKGQQFIRIGYIVDVSYPGIPSSKLIKNDIEEPSEEIEDKEEDEEDGEENSGSAGGSNESDYITEDEDENAESGEPRTFMEAVEDVANEGKERIFESEGREEEEDERVGSDSYSEINRELNKSVGEEAELGNEDKDVFEYCGYRIDKRQIEMKLMNPPVINLFEIEWSEEAPDREKSDASDEAPLKKQKVQES
ncbi:gene silencing histone chaperone [Encephalitozoon hellem ATCC 50504]|uniref:Anti-silencing function protein 1 n=1 Tax=Encephalitozoon hellem TaxID=27973 RepID=A0A9Q9F8C8_ENCHE|nr:gene silencing histone chaperone [Encephalitozoon hellem ATCC 50504]AFM98536.1 gene silencing histone chaperone [Encephalitozoon hellem ATCC 50504]UTX43479.1 anti-silencing protein 1 [Encephalitozoon hellem]|eukprot:XP_003887517.1 gene silencing histone chaperone [Encephalitozoon hellem ATCC 50504]